MGFLGMALYVLLPPRPVRQRVVGDTVVIDGSRRPRVFLLLASLLGTAGLVALVLAARRPGGLDSIQGRGDFLLAVTALTTCGLWFVTLRGRTRQQLVVRDEAVTLHTGRRATAAWATKDEVSTGAPGTDTVAVGLVDQGVGLEVTARMFATTPEQLAEAIRDALPR